MEIIKILPEQASSGPFLEQIEEQEDIAKPVENMTVKFHWKILNKNINPPRTNETEDETRKDEVKTKDISAKSSSGKFT